MNNYPVPAPSHMAQPGPAGRTRDVGTQMLLYIVTLGIWGLVWVYQTHEEMRARTGDGLGGFVALLLWVVVNPVMAFLTAEEAGKLHAATRGGPPPITAMTGLWILLPLVGYIVWYLKVQNTMNDAWSGTPQ